MGVTALIAAGGKGTRMGVGKNKIFLPLDGKTILARTLEKFENNNLITEIIIVTGKEDIEDCKKIVEEYNCKKVREIIEGGDTRGRSVYNGLKKVTQEYVAIHDAARALVTDDIITETINAAIEFKAAAPGVCCKDTLKTIDNDGFIKSTVDRQTTYLIQTPQVFNKKMLLDAYEYLNDFSATDDCGMIERMGCKIKITHGSYENIKLTTPDDIIIGENILKGRCIR